LVNAVGYDSVAKNLDFIKKAVLKKTPLLDIIDYLKKRNNNFYFISFIFSRTFFPSFANP